MESSDSMRSSPLTPRVEQQASIQEAVGTAPITNREYGAGHPVRYKPRRDRWMNTGRKHVLGGIV